MFPEYQVPREKDSLRIWADAVFVFDTNCLLNLYRYTGESFHQFMAALDHLKDRVWIPYHVALEFQRNRLSVVAERNKKIADLRSSIVKVKSDAVEKIARLNAESRQTLIDPSDFSSAMDRAISILAEKISDLEKNQKRVFEPDEVKARIEGIFDGKVGDRPQNQANLDTLQAEAERRIKERIPPGFEDKAKSKGEQGIFHHSGLRYISAAGDFIIWSQTLSFLKSSSYKALVFVTDDVKDDWWWEINDDGPKKLGPRPELAEEARREGGVEEVLFHTPKSFLEVFSEYSSKELDPRVLSEVSSVSDEQAALSETSIADMFTSNDSLGYSHFQAHEAVFAYLLEKGDMVVSQNSFPDFEFDINGVQSYGEAIFVRSSGAALISREKVKDRLSFLNDDAGLSPFFAFWVCQTPEIAADLYNRLHLGKTPRRLDKINDVPGYLKVKNGKRVFQPIDPEITLPRSDWEQALIAALLV